MTSKSKALDAEMKALSAEFKNDGKSLKDNAKGREAATKAIEAQQEKAAYLAQYIQQLQKEGKGETEECYRLQKQLADTNRTIAQYSSETDKAGKETAVSTGQLVKAGVALGALKVAASAVVGAIKGIASAAVNAAKGVWNLGVSSGQWADALITDSNRAGVDVETLQEWGYAARFIDTEVSTMTSGMKKLTQAYAKGTSAKKKSVKLTKGVTVSLKKENGEIKSQSEFYLDVIDQLHGMTNVAQRNAAAQKIFGKSYTDMLPLIESGTTALRQYSAEARDMGIIIGTENVSALGAFDDQMQKLDAQFGAVKTSIAVAFLPILETVAERMSGFMGEVSKAISDGLQEEDIDTIVDAFFGMFEPAMSDDGRQDMNALEFVGKLISKLLEQLGVNKQKIIDIGSAVMGFVWDGIKAGLGTLWANFVESLTNYSVTEDPLTKAFSTMMNSAIEWIKTSWHEFVNYDIPVAIDTAKAWGGSILTSIGDGISNAWETVKTTVSTVGTNLFTIIGEWITTAAEDGKTLISGFVSGIYTKWTEKLTTIGNIGTELMTTFGLWIEAAKNWGKDLIKNFIAGIKQKWQDLKDGVKGIGQGIKNILGFSEPKEGPLSDFHTYAPDMIDLFVKGIRDNAYKIDNALYRTFGVLPSADPAVGGARTTNMGGVNIIVNGSAGQDVNQLADIVMMKMQNAVNRREAVFA